MVDRDFSDPDEVAPLLAALDASRGDAYDTILEALVRLPLDPAEAGGPGFTSYPESAELDARLAGLERPQGFVARPASPPLDEDIAPAAVTRWFAWANDEPPGFALGNEIVGWVAACDGSFRPDLGGLFAQYRRAAFAECAAWGRRPGPWLLGDPDFEAWHGHRSTCWQIGWTVSRGGMRGLAPGLARPLADPDDKERTIAALLIADAADYAGADEPPFFGGGYGPPARPPTVQTDDARLRGLLRRAARAGVVPALAGGAPPPPAAEPAPEPPPAPPPAAEPTAPPAATHMPERLPAPRPPARPGSPAPARRPMLAGRWLRGRDAALVAAAVLGGIAVAKWLLGWLTVEIEADAPRLDDVQCTVFAPPATAPGATILVQAFAHLPQHADDAVAIATELDVDARRRVFRSLDAPVGVGSRLDFELRVPGLEVDDPVASLTWRGRAEAVQFGVRVPADAAAGAAIGTLSVSRDGVPLGHLKFKLAIEAGAQVAAAEPQGIEARRYRFAFISYASSDRDEVLRRAPMLSIAGIRYFQDVMDLEPGEVWSSGLEQAIRDADIFLLFWSSRARTSRWVRKEVDFALACQAGDDLSPPEIKPVIIEGPPVIPPWDDLAHLHFDDRARYFMSRPD